MIRAVRVHPPLYARVCPPAGRDDVPRRHEEDARSVLPRRRPGAFPSRALASLLPSLPVVSTIYRAFTQRVLTASFFNFSPSRAVSFKRVTAFFLKPFTGDFSVEGSA